MNSTKDVTITPYTKLGGDTFGQVLLQQLKGLQPDEASRWHRVFHLASTATSARPPKKFLTAVSALGEEFGKEWLRAALYGWWEVAISSKRRVGNQRRTA